MTKQATTTENLAAGIGIKAQSIRAAYYRKGHYFGLQPAKLANGRLIWPDDAIERLSAGKGACRKISDERQRGRGPSPILHAR